MIILIILSPCSSLSTKSSINNVVSSNSESSLKALENWGGLGNDELIRQAPSMHKKKRFTKYMESHPEIERVLNIPSTRSTWKNVLINGNSATSINLKKNKYMVHNTCPFDSIASILAMACTDNSAYKQFVHSSGNDMLKFCKNLANHKTSKKTYIDRLILLK